ncbi:MAG: haloacid dehalogenase-like hydrolase [Clostridia bacterium]|nr:haloacid dehalogenase-like hydrolase [Clostridia bacterium]
MHKKNAIITVLAILVIALGVLLCVTNADKGKLSDANNGLAAQVGSLEAQVSTLKDEAAQTAETAKAELDKMEKARDEAEAALQALREEASEAAQAAETAKAELDKVEKARDEAEAALQTLRGETSEAAQTAASALDMDFAVVFPSWNPDSAALRELVDFVLTSIDESSAGYIAPADRVATFGMDGTIISEKAPVCIDSCLTMYRVLDDPAYKATKEERAAMQEMRDRAYATGENDNPDTLAKNDLIASAFAGMTPAEFRAYVVDFADNVDAVGFSGMTYGQSFYKPMLEVIDFLRANGYDVWMVSACEREVVRGIVERLGFPYDHVIGTDVVYAASGSTGALVDEYNMGHVVYAASGRNSLLADEYNMGQDEQIVLGGPLNEIEVGKSGKPAAIAREIGKRPVLAFGNSSGDFSMLNYAEGNPDHPGMGILVVCDDTVREYGSETKAAGFYAEVEAQGWTAFSMANDWLTIYGDGVEKTGLPGGQRIE